MSDLFASPNHYLHSFDDGKAVFVPMDRAAYRRSIFLDQRIQPAAPGAMRVPLAEIPHVFDVPPRTAWIFHIAHCGSTLLARALDELGAGLVLREPYALRQMGAALDPKLLALTLRMLGKRYRGDGPTLVKANVPVNFILPEIAAADSSAPAVLLHFGLRDYLLAILRSDNHRAWLRRVTGELAGYLGDLSVLSDAECAAALWLAQMRRFAAALAIMPNASTLDAERFFADPAATLRAVAARLGIYVDDGAVSELVGGPLFATYSKNPGVAFANADRVAGRAQLEDALAGELSGADAWLERSAPDRASLAHAIVAAAT